MKLFRRKKTKAILMESRKAESNNTIQDNYQFTQQTIHQPAPQATISSDSKMARLMQLISCAIEDWAKEYHLENMPKKIVFEQALDAMRAIEIIWNNKAQ